MKIALIALPSPFAAEPATNPPLGLCYISAYLKQYGYNNIEGLDFGLHPNYDYYNTLEWLELIPLDADFYGIFCMTPQYFWLPPIVRHILMLNPNAKIIVGGPHATYCPQDCANTGADYVVRGDGEYAMLDIVQGTRLSATSLVHKIKDLDSLPFPDRELFGLKNYKRTLQGEPAIHIMTLRGCPFRCAFCAREYNSSPIRYRSVDDVMLELLSLYTRHDVRSFIVYDETFTLKRQRVLDFCDRFRELGVKWRCWTRSNILTRELLHEMKRSGLNNLLMGIESGDDKILKNINKGTTVKQNRDALLMCKEANIPVQVSLLYGSPGETKESLDNTIRLIEETQPEEWIVSVLSPIPGSDIWKRPEHYGIIFDKEWVIKNYYTMTHRIGDSGVGTMWARPNTMTQSEYQSYLKYFISELTRVCPPKNIQDTHQDIHLDKV